jgi:hypothetical protein
MKESTFVILSEAKDLRSLLRFNDLRTTAEILRFAQDDTFRILSHLQRPGKGGGVPGRALKGRQTECASITTLQGLGPKMKYPFIASTQAGGQGFARPPLQG